MKQLTLRKLAACLLTGALLAGATGCSTVNAETVQPSDKADDTVAAEKTAERVRDPDAAPSKDETVYVIADASGAAQRIIVSDWLSNGAGAATIADRSTLSGITNVKGDETFTPGQDGALSWNAGGNDIYYQGDSGAALPVTLSVSYTLNGKTVTPDALAGQSGKVTIRFTYQNHEKRTVTVNGQSETVYVPFLVMTGLLLDADRFSNVTVSSGKLVSDGDHLVVMGCAVPGLQESLGAAGSDVSLPSSVEITADASSFSLGSVMSIVMNAGLEDLDLSGVSSLDELSGSLGQLSAASGELADGSSRLYGYLQQLMTETDALVPGVEQLYAGSVTMADSITTLAAGAAKLQGYVNELSRGLTTLSKNSASLNAGAKQVFQSLLDQANTQLAASGLDVPTLTVENYAAVLDGVGAKLSPDAVAKLAESTAREAVTAQVNANRAAVEAAVTAAVESAALQKALGESGHTASEYAASSELKTAIDAGVASYMQSAEGKAAVSAATEKKLGALVEESMQSADVQSKLTAAKAQAQSGYTAITALRQQLDSYNQFYTGLLAYTGGVDAAAAGAQQLSGGMDTLVAGTQQLMSGSGTLRDGVNQLREKTALLVSAIGQITEGAGTLADGMNAFDRDGIAKLTDALGGDIGSLVDRLQALSDVSGAYRNFSGIADGMDGSVKFVFKTAAIGEN